MSFLEKYYVVSSLFEGETNSYRAQELATGRPVVLHQLFADRAPAGQPDLASLVSRLVPRGGPGVEHFVGMGEDSGRVFVVTADNPACLNLRQWLHSMAEAQAAAEDNAVPTTGAESTQMFAGLRPEQLAPRTAETSSAPGAGGAPIEDNAARSHEAGEFTRAFDTPTAAAGPVTPAQAPFKFPPRSARPSPRLRGQVPAGFEVVYQSPKRQAAALPEEVNTPTLLASQSPLAPAAAPEQPSASGATPSQAVPPGVIDEFAQNFSRLGEPAVDAPSSAPGPAVPFAPSAEAAGADSPGEVTKQFVGLGNPTLREAPPAQPPIPRREASPEVPAPQAALENSGLGEPTRPFEGMKAPASGPVSPPVRPVAEGSGAPAPDQSLGSRGLTKEFHGLGDSAQNAPTRLPNAPAAPVPPRAQSEPGDFTRMFFGAGKAAPPAGPPTEPASGQIVPQTPADNAAPGEFTLMFHTPASRASTPKASEPAPVRKPPPAASPLEAPPDTSQTGEFTAMFLVGDHAHKPAPPAEKPSPPRGLAVRGDPRPRAPESKPASTGPGEFTQMFQWRTDASRAPGDVHPAPPGVPLSSSSPKGRGEFTQMMQGYRPPAPQTPPLEVPNIPTPPPASPAKRAPGEFTMLFQKPAQATPVPPSAPPPTPQVMQPPPPPPAAPPHQRGEYTRMFEAPPMAPPTLAAPGPGFSGAPAATPPLPQFQAPPTPQFQAPTPPAYAAPAQPAMPQAPQFQPPAPQFQPPPMPQPAGTGAPKPRSFLVLLLVLGGLFVIAVALILFFALKH